jgi:hypothetical protein
MNITEKLWYESLGITASPSKYVHAIERVNELTGLIGSVELDTLTDFMVDLEFPTIER